jgi:hypothetical protein
MRKFLFLLAAVVLIGCNDVHSLRPLIHDADGAPSFRSGLWVGVDKACPVDTALPVDQWPSCAAPMMIEPGRITGAKKDSRRDLITYRLNGRLPTLIQTRIVQDPGGHAPHDRLAARLGRYQYAGLAILAADADGRMTKVAYWSALCGPPPPKAKPGENPRYVTDKPLPGMTVIGDACTTRSLGAVRSAVIASRAWSTPSELRWVREAP